MALPRRNIDGARHGSRFGKFIPVAGAVFAGVNAGVEYDEGNPWGNTRNEVGFGIAAVEAGSAFLTPLVLSPSPVLCGIGLSAEVLASASSTAGIARDFMSLVLDIERKPIGEQTVERAAAPTHGLPLSSALVEWRVVLGRIRCVA